MPANWRPAAIPLTGGLVTSRPPESLQPGEFAQLDNAVFDSDGAPRKRHGHTAADVYWGAPSGMPADPEWVTGYGWAPSTHIITGAGNNRTGAVRGLATRDGDLLAYDGTRMLLRAEDLPAGWVSVPNGCTADTSSHGASFPGTVHIPHLSTSNIRSADTATFDVARGDHIEVAIYRGERTIAVARDVATGSVVDDTDLSIGGLGTATKVGIAYIPPASGAVYGTFVAYQNDTSAADLYIQWASEASPGTWTTITVTTTAASDGVTIKADANYAYVAQVDGGGLIWIERVDRFGTRTSFNIVGAGGVGTSYLDIAVHPDGRLMLAYVVAAATDDVYAAFYQADFATPIVAPYAIYTGSKTVISDVTCEWSLLTEQTGGGDPEGLVFIPGAAGGDLDVCLVQGASATLGSVLPRCDLGSRAFRVGNTVGLVVQHYSALNPLLVQYVAMYFDHKGNMTFDVMVPCGSWFRGSAAVGHPPVSTRVVDLQVHLSGLNRRPYDPAAQIHSVTLDFGAPLRSVQAGRSTYFAGALVWDFDGSTICESGFLDTPLPSYAASATAGSMTASSTYTYRAYMVQKNSQGEVSRSAAVTSTVSLGVGQTAVDITLPAMPMCTRPYTYWEIYRSQSNGAVLTQVPSVIQGLVTYTRFPVSRYTQYIVRDGNSDAALATMPIDPVPFGVLDNVAPPACSVIAQGKDRVWYAGGDLLPGQVAYSKFWDPGETPAWNEALLVETDRTGPVTLVGFVGDWLITGSRASLYQFAGDGPSNLGLGDFTPARLISSDTGCISTDSVLLTPLGVAFQSRKGPRVLGPGGSLLTDQDGLLGSDVDASFAGRTVVGACVVPEQDHARWLLDDGTLMAWDYSVNNWARWTTFTLSPYGTPNALRYHNGGQVLAEADRVLWEDEGEATDGASAYRFIASMGWMGPHGPLSWGRLRRWSLEGAALGPFTAQVFVDYDYKLGPRRETYTWAASTSYAGADGTTYDHDPGGWGSDATWGSSPSWGGDTADGGAFPVNVRFNRQKATSFRMTITDSGEPNLTLALRVLTIEFAPMAGLVRVGGRNI